jgi:hypothetical protein
LNRITPKLTPLASSHLCTQEHHYHGLAVRAECEAIELKLLTQTLLLSTADGNRDDHGCNMSGRMDHVIERANQLGDEKLIARCCLVAAKVILARNS